MGWSNCVRFLLISWLLGVHWGAVSLGQSPISTADPQTKTRVKRVLMIIADDLRANVLGCYGDKICQTPHLDRLARSGLVFRNAYCQGTWCAPSRLSLMHSRYVGEQGVNLGEHFRNHAWHSARVGKIYHMRVPGDIIAGTNGLDIASSWTERFNMPGQEAHSQGDYACLNQNLFTRELENRQTTRMPHRMFVSVACDGDGEDQPDYKSASKAIKILQRRKNVPLFLAVGFVRPHYPMVAPRSYFEAYPYEQMQVPVTRRDDWNDMPSQGIAATNNQQNSIGKYPDNQQRMWAAYYASVSFMDAQVGRILDTLDELGLRESTAVVFTSDHGYHLGDHGFWQKANLHEQIIRVPMIVAGPGTQIGETDAIAELMDIYPTVAEWAGLSVPRDVQGQSLIPVLNGTQSNVRDAALSLDRGEFSIRTRRWHYIRYKGGEEELYDMDDDPHQFKNLAGNDQYSDQLNEMRLSLTHKQVQFKLPH